MITRATLTVLALLLTGCAAQPAPGPAAEDPLLAQYLEQHWKEFSVRHSDVERPEVAVVAVMNAEEYPAQLVSCLHEEGFPEVTLDPLGGIGYEGSQLDAYDLAMYICESRYPIDPRYTQPLTDEQLGKLYDYYANELVPCIEREGYTAPEAPTRQYFIDHFSDAPWRPYSEVSDATGESEWYRMNEVCPQTTYTLWD